MILFLSTVIVVFFSGCNRPESVALKAAIPKSPTPVSTNSVRDQLAELASDLYGEDYGTEFSEDYDAAHTTLSERGDLALFGKFEDEAIESLSYWIRSEVDIRTENYFFIRVPVSTRTTLSLYFPTKFRLFLLCKLIRLSAHASHSVANELIHEVKTLIGYERTDGYIGNDSAGPLVWVFNNFRGILCPIKFGKISARDAAQLPRSASLLPDFPPKDAIMSSSPKCHLWSLKVMMGLVVMFSHIKFENRLVIQSLRTFMAIIELMSSGTGRSCPKYVVESWYTKLLTVADQLDDLMNELQEEWRRDGDVGYHKFLNDEAIKKFNDIFTPSDIQVTTFDCLTLP